MIENKIQEWWGANFQKKELLSLRPVYGSLSYNQLYLLNDNLILKLYFEADERFKRETKTLRKLNQKDIAPRIIKQVKKDPILGVNSTLMSYLNGQNLFSTFYLYSDLEKNDAMRELAKTVQALHHTLPQNKIVMSGSLYAGQIYDLLQNPSVMETTDDTFKAFCLNTARKLETKQIQTSVALLHGDLHFGNIVVSYGKMKLVDFENSKIGPIWEELSGFLTFVLISGYLMRNSMPTLSSVYSNSSVLPYVFEFQKAYPQMFDNTNREWIEAQMLIAIMHKYAHPMGYDFKKEWTEAADLMYEQVFETDLLDRLLV